MCFWRQLYVEVRLAMPPEWWSRLGLVAALEPKTPRSLMLWTADASVGRDLALAICIRREGRRLGIIILFNYVTSKHREGATSLQALQTRLGGMSDVEPCDRRVHEASHDTSA
jgi:hypothetical protein